MQIVIATTNQNKIRRLELLIKLVNPEIKISNVLKLNISTPIEDGNTQTENLLIKLRHYHDLLGGNVIAEDDAIELLVGKDYTPIININSFITNGTDQFDEWKRYLQENKVTRARLVKSYGTMIDNSVKIEEVVIPLVVETKADVPAQNEKNILNNFMGMEATGKTFVKMSMEERDNYMQTACLPALTKLLTR